jgi:hypothetical protein
VPEVVPQGLAGIVDGIAQQLCSDFQLGQEPVCAQVRRRPLAGSQISGAVIPG